MGCRTPGVPGAFKLPAHPACLPTEARTHRGEKGQWPKWAPLCGRPLCKSDSDNSPIFSAGPYILSNPDTEAQNRRIEWPDFKSRAIWLTCPIHCVTHLPVPEKNRGKAGDHLVASWGVTAFDSLWLQELLQLCRYRCAGPSGGRTRGLVLDLGQDYCQL